jgi:mRNA interferase MazF
MMDYKQGEIVLVWFPESDLITIKKRPALIIQADNLNTGLDQIIIAMITSNLERRFHKCRIFVDSDSVDGKESGLLSKSVIMLDNLATVKTKEIYKKIGNYSRIEEIKTCIRLTFNL